MTSNEERANALVRALRAALERDRQTIEELCTGDTADTDFCTENG